MGGFEAETPVSVEPSLKYHPGVFEVLTQTRNPGRGPCMVGSLTGAVSSQRVTEEFEGYLGPVGNRTDSAMAKGSLTARPTSRAGAKAGHSDPVVLYGRAIAQRIKGTPGITAKDIAAKATRTVVEGIKAYRRHWWSPIKTQHLVMQTLL